jgi:hypothetical protein
VPLSTATVTCLNSARSPLRRFDPKIRMVIHIALRTRYPITRTFFCSVWLVVCSLRAVRCILTARFTRPPMFRIKLPFFRKKEAVECDATAGRPPLQSAGTHVVCEVSGSLVERDEGAMRVTSLPGAISDLPDSDPADCSHPQDAASSGVTESATASSSVGDTIPRSPAARPLSIKGSASALSIRELVADLRALSARAPPPGLPPHHRSGSHGSSSPRAISTKPSPPPPTRSQSIREMVAELRELSHRAPIQYSASRGGGGRSSSSRGLGRPPPLSASAPCMRELAASARRLPVQHTAASAAAAAEGAAPSLPHGCGDQRGGATTLLASGLGGSKGASSGGSSAMPRTAALLGMDPWRANPLRVRTHRGGNGALTGGATGSNKGGSSRAQPAARMQPPQAQARASGGAARAGGARVSEIVPASPPLSPLSRGALQQPLSSGPPESSFFLSAEDEQAL